MSIFGIQPPFTNPWVNLGQIDTSWWSERFPGMWERNEAWRFNQMLLGRGHQDGNLQTGANVGGYSGNTQLSFKRTEQPLSDLLDRVLQEYQRAYDEYRQAVEERYQEAKDIAGQLWQRGTQAATNLYSSVVPQWYARSTNAMNMLQGLGEQALKDIERAYYEKEQDARQSLVARGLTGTTIPTSVSTVLEREKQDAIGRTKEAIRNQLLNTYLATTADAAQSAERLGILGIETDRTLTKEMLDIIANREDLPPQIDLLVKLAEIAGRGATNEEILFGGAAGGSDGGGQVPFIAVTPPNVVFPFWIRPSNPPHTPRTGTPPEREPQTAAPDIVPMWPNLGNMPGAPMPMPMPGMPEMPTSYNPAPVAVPEMPEISVPEAPPMGEDPYSYIREMSEEELYRLCVEGALPLELSWICYEFPDPQLLDLLRQMGAMG